MITNYKDLPFGAYLEIQAKNRDESLSSEIERQVATIAILSGRTEDELLRLPLPEYRRLSEGAAFLRTAYPANGQNAARRAFIVRGVELVPTRRAERLTTAQYVDFQTLVARMDDQGDAVVALLSVILVPKGKRYNEGYDIVEVQDAIREEMSTSDALDVLAFFFASLKASMLALPTFSDKDLRKAKTEEIREKMRKANALREELIRNAGDGWRVWMP